MILIFGIQIRTFRRPDLFLSELYEILTELCPLFDSTMIAIGTPCQRDILRIARNRILIFNIQIKINV